MSEAAQGKLQGRCSRGIEPLDVVERDQKLVHRQLAKKPEDRGADGALIGGVPIGFVEQERDLKRSTLRGGKPFYLVVRTPEQVAERGKRQFALGCSRSRFEHAKTKLTCTLDSSQQERRLSSSGFALEEQDTAALSFEPEKSISECELALATQNRSHAWSVGDFDA
jgi:hypothetical protein